jgi:NAD(P)-dependent dehydrogenase (short-subunit alcohol dehydrogenase family)
MRILVTGANRGIGLALVEHYLAGGHDVHATARDLAAASTLQSLRDRYGTKLALHPLDVRDEASCRALRDALLGAPIDLLVNNAGIGRDAPDEPAEILAVVDTNAVGPLRVVVALRELVRAAKGKIIFVTSLLGSIGNNTSGEAYAYRMSKAALNMAARNVAHEERLHGVVVALVHPGWVRTEMGGPDAPLRAEESAAAIAAIAATVTLEKAGRFFNVDGTELPW